MCVGVPMRIQSIGPGVAWAEVDGERRQISTLLLDQEPAAGEHVLVHGVNAIRRLEAEEALLIRDALAAVLAAAAGRPFDHLVADLIDREPELPAHLRPSTPV
jgi:hydrogenase expression/formation protein HypC